MTIEGGGAIFSEKVIRILSRKKELKEDQLNAIDKLKRNKRLSKSEFWGVYESIRQEGPEVKYQTPYKWINLEE